MKCMRMFIYLIDDRAWCMRDADFKYANDSVLLVSHDDYKQCSTETPVARFTSGDTKFRLDGNGPFYFVSGVPGHCEAGQRMIARARAPSSMTAGAPAAAPGMPPTTVINGGGAPSSARAAAPPVGSGSSATPITIPTSTTPSPSPAPPASGASRRALGVASSIVLGLVVVGVVSLFVVV